MKIAVATDDFINVSGHVGRCAGFLVYDIEKGEVVSIEERKNSFTNHSRGGHEHHSHHQHGSGHGSNDGHKRLAKGLQDCEYLISHGMGRRLIDEIKLFRITPIVTSESIAEVAAVKLEAGNLEMEEKFICK